MNLVLIETGGNQAYLFETNRLAEVVGASELVFRSTTSWVEDAVSAVTGLNPVDLASARIPEAPIEVVVRTSGKALMLFAEPEAAREVVYLVTARALVEAPGLQLYAAILPVPDLECLYDDENGAVRQAHRSLAASRAARPGGPDRFLRLPPVADCVSSGMPAAAEATDRNHTAARSHSTWAKLNAARAAQDRLTSEGVEQVGDADAIGGVTAALRHLGELEDRLDTQARWVGVVHADGNGFGQMLIELPIACDGWRNYLDTFRELSAELDRCGRSAYGAACEKVWPGDTSPPVIPLVRGGDDLTVLCDGVDAVAFAKEYLSAFEVETQRNSCISAVARELDMGDRLTACAGVAITKPHYPFSLGYSLAEELLVSAKTVKTSLEDPASALDFHVHYDSVAAPLDRIRASMHTEDGARLWNGPWLLGPHTGEGWGAGRSLDELSRLIEALNERDGRGHRRISSSQTHRLRSVLRESRSLVDKHYVELCSELPAAATLAPSGEDGTLFTGEPARTAILDAMTLAGIQAWGRA